MVAGTPTPPFLADSIDDSVQPYQFSPPKARFPYEVQIFGAVPFESSNGSTAGLVQVSNGGGWRATTATVDATAYVGPNARVLGSAQVRNNARILDYAVVEGIAKVLSNAVVSGHALVRDSAIVTGYAKVRDYAMVINNSVVQDYARVLERGQVTGGATNRDWATIKGSASTWYEPGTSVGAYSGGDGVLDGDFSTCQLVTNGFQFGFEEYNPGPLQWITNRVAPRRLYAAYEFDAPHDSLAKDLLGVTDGYLEGNPAWIASDGSRAGFMAFSGSNYVLLSKSLSDSPEITLAAWIKWSGGVSNQPVWYFGSATNACMYRLRTTGRATRSLSSATAGLTERSPPPPCPSAYGLMSPSPCPTAPLAGFTSTARSPPAAPSPSLQTPSTPAIPIPPPNTTIWRAARAIAFLSSKARWTASASIQAR